MLAPQGGARKAQGSGHQSCTSNWICSCPRLINGLIGRLRIELCCANGTMVEVSLHLVDGNPLTEHLSSPPVAEVMRMDSGQPQIGGRLPNHVPGRIWGEGLAPFLGAIPRVAYELLPRSRIQPCVEVFLHGLQGRGSEAQRDLSSASAAALAADNG